MKDKKADLNSIIEENNECIKKIWKKLIIYIEDNENFINIIVKYNWLAKFLSIILFPFFIFIVGIHNAKIEFNNVWDKNYIVYKETICKNSITYQQLCYNYGGEI